MARTVADVRLLFGAMARPDAHDSLWVPIPESKPIRKRIGVLRQMGKTPVDPVIASAVDQASARLATQGYAVEEFTPAGLERAPNVWAFFFGELSGNRRLLEGRESEAHWTATEFLRDTPWPAVPVIQDHYAERERLRAAVLDQMAPFDAILSPPCSITGFRHRERRYDVAGKSMSQFAAMTLATPWNLFGFPALVMPYGGSSIQLVGHAFEDYAVLEIGAQLE
jgi:Asp-tRNA(Asn)/Glu-tRNA(Gln) amidotransferase A subunit family amidase